MTISVEPNVGLWTETFSATSINIAKSTPLVQIALAMLGGSGKGEHDGREQTNT